MLPFSCLRHFFGTSFLQFFFLRFSAAENQCSRICRSARNTGSAPSAPHFSSFSFFFCMYGLPPLPTSVLDLHFMCHISEVSTFIVMLRLLDTRSRIRVEFPFRWTPSEYMCATASRDCIYPPPRTAQRVRLRLNLAWLTSDLCAAIVPRAFLVSRYGRSFFHSSNGTTVKIYILKSSPNSDFTVGVVAAVGVSA